MAKNHIKVKFTFICLVKNLGVQNFLMVLEFFVLCWAFGCSLLRCLFVVLLFCFIVKKSEKGFKYARLERGSCLSGKGDVNYLSLETLIS